MLTFSFFYVIGERRDMQTSKSKKRQCFFFFLIEVKYDPDIS